MNIADLRKDYTQAALDERDALPNPFNLFSLWFDQALKAQLPEPNAMTLATVNAQGRPSARIVLIKGLDPRGFCFFTNYESRKGQELLANPHAALLFHWTELERQVRIEGRVSKVSPQESDEYYRSRPLGSKLGAWASPQSRVLQDRAELENRYGEVKSRESESPDRPPFWGGYRLEPDYFEFWQGRPSRLHDRLAYTLGAGGEWSMSRLAP